MGLVSPHGRQLRRAETFARRASGEREQGRPRAPEDLPRCSTRRRQNLRDAGAGQAPPPRWRRHGDRRRRNPWPRRDRHADQGFRGRSQEAAALQGPRAGRDGSRRDPAAQAQARARRRARAHERGRQPSSQALSGRRRAARLRHRRLYDPEHPARRKPQRRGRRDHPCAGARDRAGFHHRPRRRHRGRGSHAGRPVAAAEGRQGLHAGAGRARHPQLFHRGQPDGLARAGAAPHRRTRRRSDAVLPAHPCDQGAVGNGRSRPGRDQRGHLLRCAGALGAEAGRPPPRTLDGALRGNGVVRAPERTRAHVHR